MHSFIQRIFWNAIEEIRRLSLEKIIFSEQDCKILE